MLTQAEGNTSDAYLAYVATWADTYRYTSEGSFSAPYHFIDAQDKPPGTCGVDYDRDCGDEGCVISAIANYVSALRSIDFPCQQRYLEDTACDHADGAVCRPSASKTGVSPPNTPRRRSNSSSTSSAT